MEQRDVGFDANRSVYILAHSRYFGSRTVREVVVKTKIVTRVAIRFIIVKTEFIAVKTEIVTRVAVRFNHCFGFDANLFDYILANYYYFEIKAMRKVALRVMSAVGGRRVLE